MRLRVRLRLNIKCLLELNVSCPGEKLGGPVDSILEANKQGGRRPFVQDDRGGVQVPGAGSQTEAAGVVTEVRGRDAPQPQAELLPVTVTVVDPPGLGDGSSVSEPGHLEGGDGELGPDLSTAPTHPH